MTKLEDQDWVINPNTGNKINMTKLLKEQKLAQVLITSEFPFFDELLHKLTFIYTFQVPTQATDGTRLFINPEFASKLSLRMKAFVMMHEVMHCALDHLERGRNHPRERSNIAADYEVNGLLEMSGVVTKSQLAPYLFDEKYQGKNYEVIYAMNPSGSGSADIQQGGQSGSGVASDNEQGQQGSSDSRIDKMSADGAAENAQQSADRAKEAADRAAKSADKNAASKAKNAADKAQQAANEAQSAADKMDANTARQKAKEARDAANEAQSAAGKGESTGNSQASTGARQEAAEACGSCGGMISQKAGAEIAKSEGYSSSDCKEESSSAVSKSWTQATIDACNHNNTPGMGDLVSHLKDYYITSHDWKNELKKYIGRALSDIDYETRLGKRKWLIRDEIKPYNVPSETAFDNVVFLIDCSGSISDDLLQRIISECWTICKKKKVKHVTYCYYDDGIRQIETNDTLKSDGIINKEMVSRIRAGAAKPTKDVHGRGGNQEDTVMKQLIEMLKKSHRKLELAMWFTDGYTYAIPVRPKMQIKHMIWVVYDNNNFEAKDDSKVIHISSKDLGKK